MKLKFATFLRQVADRLAPAETWTVNGNMRVGPITQHQVFTNGHFCTVDAAQVARALYDQRRR